jgi:hypothetical protein
MSKKLLAKYRGVFKRLNIPRPPGIIDNYEYLNSCEIEYCITPDCDKGWDIEEVDGKEYFTHSRYTNKLGKYKLHNIGVKSVLDRKINKITRLLFPIVDPNLDIYELGFSFFNSEPISNKFKCFWQTRRGKRYSRYIQYSKYRNMIKEQHHPGTVNKSKQPKKHDDEFEKYLIEKNEKKRIMQQQVEIEKEEKRKNYDSDDYY